MIATLQDLIAPLPLAEFTRILRERTVTLQRATGASRFAELLDWPTLRGLIESGAVPPARLTVTRETRTLPQFLYVDAGKINTAKLDTLLRNGASLVVQALDDFVPALGALCTNIHKQLGERVWSIVIATTGAGGAFRTHYDSADFIVLQLEGAKRWRILGPPDVHPVESRPQTTPCDDVVFDDVLRPGDTLFMPAGYWHHCENGPELSLHCVISMKAPTGLAAVQALVAQLPEDEMFRTPLSRLGGTAERAAYEAALKARLIAKIEQTSLGELLAGSEKGTDERYNG